MKKLFKNYVNLLTIQSVEKFCNTHNIILSYKEKIYLLDLIKNNYEDILLNEEKYLKDLKNHINKSEYDKVLSLFYFYKEKYKSYLF